MARVSSDPMLFPEHGPRRVERAHAISPRPGEDVFTCEAALPEDAGSLWYYFILEYDDGDALRAAVNASALADENLRAHPVSPLYYGDARDHCYGAGEVYGCEPPSYQITVYDPAGEGPAWMREATMMQIMVDRFHRAGEKDQKGPRAVVLLPRKLVRLARPQPGTGRAGAFRQRLFRRRSARHRGKAALHREFGRDGFVPEPHLPLALEPQVRHRQLFAGGPLLRHGGRFALVVRGGEEARHPRDPRRRVFPHGGGQRLLQQIRHLRRGDGRVPR